MLICASCLFLSIPQSFFTLCSKVDKIVTEKSLVGSMESKRVLMPQNSSNNASKLAEHSSVKPDHSSATSANHNNTVGKTSENVQSKAYASVIPVSFQFMMPVMFIFGFQSYSCCEELSCYCF